MKYIIATLAAFFALSASAQEPDDNTFGVHAVSWHSGGICQNNENPGVYVQIDDGITFGTYHNSCDRQTFYVGGEVFSHQVGPVEVGVFAMAATGYFAPIIPAAFVTLEMPVTEKQSVRLAGNRWDGVTMVHLSVETKF